MDFIKKQSIGAYVGAAAVVFGIVSLIIYIVNGVSAGYFQGSVSGGVVTMTIFAILFATGAIVLAQFKFDGTIGMVVKIACGALMIGAALLLIASLLNFIGDRAQGLGYIFGADENTLSEIQKPENMSSAYTAIVGFVFYGITWLCAVVSTFFKIVKEDKI